MHPDRGFEASRLKILLFLVMACWPIYQHRVADRLNKCQTVMSKGRCVSVCKQAFNVTILLEASAVCLTNNSQMPAQQKFSMQAGFYVIIFFFRLYQQWSNRWLQYRWPTSAEQLDPWQNSVSSKARRYCFRAMYASARDSRTTVVGSGSEKDKAGQRKRARHVRLNVHQSLWHTFKPYKLHTVSNTWLGKCTLLCAWVSSVTFTMCATKSVISCKSYIT